MQKNSSYTTSVSGIILSGGLSSRFQIRNEPWQDKAIVKFSHSKTLLENAINVLSEICQEILIIVNDRERKETYSKLLSNMKSINKKKIRFIIDNQTFLCSGPSRGLISGIYEAQNKLAVVLPVDMPLVNSQLLLDLVSNIEDSAMIVPFWSTTGKIEPLITAINIEKIQTACSIITDIRKSRADDLHRAVDKIKFHTINVDLEKEAEYYFHGINKRDALSLIAKSISPLPIFDSSKSFIISQKYNERILDELSQFLSKSSLLQPDQGYLEKALTLVKRLNDEGLFFYAGLLVYNLNEILLNLIDSESNSPEKNCIINELLSIGINSFKKEAVKWHKSGISFLELHSYQDINIMYTNQKQKPKIEEIETKILALKEMMNLMKKSHKHSTMDDLIYSKIPHFMDKARKLIQQAEIDFNESSPQFETNFLWDHSYRVGKIAFALAKKEGIDPFIPSIGALLHDSGKFTLGSYHKDDIPEEEHSAKITRDILRSEGIPEDTIKEIIDSLLALYNENYSCNKNCKIIHDADRLDKLGSLGIANFFTKSTLRGTNLTDTILKQLSRELTYAYLSPKTMLTRSGRELAEIKSKITIEYYENLLAEIRAYNLGDYHIRKFSFSSIDDIYLLVPQKCSKCEGEYFIKLNSEKGIKCEKLIATYQCNSCNDKYTIAFCLPIITQQ